MKTVVIYASPNGTTKMAINFLASIFQKNGHDFITIDVSRPEAKKESAAKLLIDADIIGIASPVYHLRIFKTLDKYLKMNLSYITQMSKVKSAFALVTYGGVTSGKALLNISNILGKNNIPVCGALKIKAPHFWKTDGYPDDETKLVIEDFFNRLDSKNFASISFTRTKSVFSYQKKLIKFIYPFGRIIGYIRRQHISFDESKCNKCGRCIKECPASAINIRENAYRSSSKCVYCYHCAVICPKKAFNTDITKIEKIVHTNRSIAGTEYPQNEIFA
ncbi:MAG: EFR1 family ferrodoxin [Spirochaetes bacterium]|nr:EFR1 family ferrodoxin [Spirochaetota bacterium]